MPLSVGDTALVNTTSGNIATSAKYHEIFIIWKKKDSPSELWYKETIDEGEEGMALAVHYGQIYCIQRERPILTHCFDPFPKIESPISSLHSMGWPAYVTAYLWY